MADNNRASADDKNQSWKMLCNSQVILELDGLTDLLQQFVAQMQRERVICAHGVPFNANPDTPPTIPPATIPD